MTENKPDNYLPIAEMGRMYADEGLQKEFKGRLLSHLLFSFLEHPILTARDAIGELFKLPVRRRENKQELKGREEILKEYAQNGELELEYVSNEEGGDGVKSVISLYDNGNRLKSINAPDHCDCCGISITGPNGIAHIHLSPQVLDPELMNIGDPKPMREVDYAGHIIKTLYELAAGKEADLASFSPDFKEAELKRMGEFLLEHLEVLNQLQLIVTGGDIAMQEMLLTVFKNGGILRNRNDIERRVPQIPTVASREKSNFAQFSKHRQVHPAKRIIVGKRGVIVQHQNSGKILTELKWKTKHTT